MVIKIKNDPITQITYNMFIHLSSHKQTIILRNETFIIQYCHRQTQKVKFLYFDNYSGTTNENRWIRNGKFHRIGAPANISYFKNGNIQHEEWFKDGKFHRHGGAPAEIRYYKNGQIYFERWYEDGKWCSCIYRIL